MWNSRISVIDLHRSIYFCAYQCHYVNSCFSTCVFEFFELETANYFWNSACRIINSLFHSTDFRPLDLQHSQRDGVWQRAVEDNCFSVGGIAVAVAGDYQRRTLIICINQKRKTAIAPKSAFQTSLKTPVRNTIIF